MNWMKHTQEIPAPISLALQEHHELHEMVNTVVLYTSNDRINGDERDGLSDTWRHAASGICKFTNLSSVVIAFCSECTDGDTHYRWVNEDVEFRTIVMKTIFAALNSKEYPTVRLRCLTIKNLQNMDNPEVTQSLDFTNALSRLRELHLHITTEDDPELSLSYDTLHDFFGQTLPKTWLEPICEQLTRLTLFTSTFWGWAPAFEPRKIHFPSLKISRTE